MDAAGKLDEFVTRTGVLSVRAMLTWCMELISMGEAGEAWLVLLTTHSMLDMAELDAALGAMEARRERRV